MDEQTVEKLITQIEAIGAEKEQKAAVDRAVQEIERFKGELTKPAQINLIRENGRIVGGEVRRGSLTQRVKLD